MLVVGMSPAFLEVTATLIKAKTETKRLLALLEDPHPGLMTWLEAVDAQAGKVAGIFGYYPKGAK